MSNYKPDLIERAAWNVVNTGAVANDIKLIYAHQHDAQMVPPYATISIDSRTPQGQPDRIEMNDSGVMALYGTRIGGGTVMCVGDNAGDMADRLVNWLTTLAASYASRRFGLVVHTANPVPMEPFQLDGQVWQQACAIDFQYRVGVVYDDDVGIISIVDITSRVDTIDGHLRLWVDGSKHVYDFEVVPENEYTPHTVAARPALVKTPHDGTYKSVTWHTSDPSVVDILTTPHGLQIGDAGQATLTVTMLTDEDKEIVRTAVINVVEEIPDVGVEYMTIDPVPFRPVGVYATPHHTVHTNRHVVSYEYRSSDESVVGLVSAPIKLDLKKPGAAALTIRAYFEGGEWVEATAVIGVIP